VESDNEEVSFTNSEAPITFGVSFDFAFTVAFSISFNAAFGGVTLSFFFTDAEAPVAFGVAAEDVLENLVLLGLPLSMDLDVDGDV
jgi:hypothetical protein